MSTVRCFLALFLALTAELASAQMMRPPAFATGIPGRMQMDAIFMQRQQSRTLLYREALEELRKNPQAADLPPCSAAQAGRPCLAIDAPAAKLPEPELVRPARPPAVSPAVEASVPAAAVKPPAVAGSEAPVPAPTPAVVARPVGKRLALLVGNNNYPSPIPALETPVADVTRIAAVLSSRFGYTTHVVKDAGQARIIEELNRLAATVKPEDRVLLFYAGHGYLMEDINMGFWIPVDASVKTAKGWISNSDISRLLGAIPANQLILISDSCFSGSLTREQRIAEDAVSLPSAMERRSVVVLSSGGDEPVSDVGKEGHSIFAWNLIRTLENIGAVTPGVRVWRTVRNEVKKEYPQEAQYGAVLSAGHVSGGDYLFMPH